MTTKSKPSGVAPRSATKKVGTKQPAGRFVLSRQEQTKLMVRHLKSLESSDKKAATKILQRAGILDAEGQLAEPYCSAA